MKMGKMGNLTPEEIEMCKREDEKTLKDIKRILQYVKKTGYPQKKTRYGNQIDTIIMLQSNDLAHFGRPIPEICDYNCFHLTEKGEEFLKKEVL